MVGVLGCHFGRDKKLDIAQMFEQLHKDFGARCGQIFVGSPRSPRMSDIAFSKYMEEAKAVRNVIEKHGLKLYIHAPYVLNFCQQHDQDPYHVQALIRELKIADAMGAEGCVLHMGKAVKLAVDVAEDVFYANLCKVIDICQTEHIRAKIIVETSAGQGTELYATMQNTLDPLVQFMSKFTATHKKHIRLCVDTCHIFAAGYNINTEADVTRFWKEWEDKIGLEWLAVIHMNNSVKQLGCRVDRHAILSKGSIPMEGIAAFAKAAAKHNIPMVIETPWCQYDIPVLHEMVAKSIKTLTKRDWEAWFKEKRMTHMLSMLDVDPGL